MRNERLCAEHFRLSLALTAWSPARPGQFAHILPEGGQDARHASVSSPGADRPTLRRAFSLAGQRLGGDTSEIDLIYRVVGKVTRALAALVPDDRVSVFGPLGNVFPISYSKPNAWLVAGGVGLPPMLWLAEALASAGKQQVAFCGTQRAALLPLTLDPEAPPATDARLAVPSAAEFARSGAGVVISTDDGSLGFRGHVGAAMEAYHEANPIAPETLVVYTCGPERMMRFVAQYCVERGIECHVCMERAMGCGMGTCQSCVVPVVDRADPDGWRYELCCMEGPVFDADRIVWEPATQGV